MTRWLGQIGQASRQREQGNLGVGKPQLTDKLLLAGGRCVPGQGELRGRVGIEALLSDPLDGIEITGLLHAAGQLGRSLGGSKDLPRIAETLVCGHGTYPDPTHLGDLPDHVAGQPVFFGRNTRFRHALTHRKGQQIEQPDAQKPAKLDLVQDMETLEAEDRVRQASRLGRIGGAGPVPGQQCLKRGTVGQGQLHCGRFAQRFGQQLGRPLGHGVALRGVASQRELPKGEACGLGVGPGHGLVKVHRSATGQSAEQDEKRKPLAQGCRHVHGALP